MKKNSDAYRKQVEEVRRVLTASVAGHFVRETFDRRIGSQLVGKVSDLLSDWGLSTCYQLAVQENRQLVPNARRWCEEAGLSAEADAYDAAALQHYVQVKTAALKHQKTKLVDGLAEIDAEIIHYEEMLKS